MADLVVVLAADLVELAEPEPKPPRLTRLIFTKIMVEAQQAVVITPLVVVAVLARRALPVLVVAVELGVLEFQIQKAVQQFFKAQAAADQGELTPLRVALVEPEAAALVVLVPTALMSEAQDLLPAAQPEMVVVEQTAMHLALEAKAL